MPRKRGTLTGSYIDCSQKSIDDGKRPNLPEVLPELKRYAGSMQCDDCQELPRSRDLRRGRISIANQIYLVTTVTRDRLRIFNDLEVGRCLVGQLMRSEAHAQTLAFVIMPDHLHWLLQLTGKADLSKVVHQVKACSARNINRLGSGRGQVWQRGFHDHALRKEEDVRAYARYVVANPLRAGLVRSVRDYPLWDAIWL